MNRPIDILQDYKKQIEDTIKTAKDCFNYDDLEELNHRLIEASAAINTLDHFRDITLKVEIKYPNLTYLTEVEVLTNLSDMQEEIDNTKMKLKYLHTRKNQYNKKLDKLLYV